MAQTHSLDLEASSTQYASIADGSQTGLDITDDITLEAWINLETLPISGEISVILAKEDFGTPSRAYYFAVGNTTGTYTMRLGVNGTARLSTAFNPVVGVWYHVAVTRLKSSGAITFYLNGKAWGTATDTAAFTNSTAAFAIGDRFNSGAADTNSLWDGKIKDVRIFNDVRTANEIASDAHTENVSDANLKGEWNLNNVYTDSSGNSNTITASGSPAFSTSVPWTAPAGVDGSANLETNLVSYWGLSDANDATASGNNLTNNNTVTFTTGKIASAADFESGSSQSLSRSDNASLSITGALSISCWVNFESLPTAAIRAFAAKYDSTDTAYLFGYREDGGPAGLHVRLSSATSTDKADLWTWAPSLATWYHVVMVYNPSASATNRVVTYINGVFQGTGINGESWDASILNGASAFRLGASDIGNYHDGLLDEVAIYDRALNWGDVLDLYNNGTGIGFSSGTVYTLTADAGSYIFAGQDVTITLSRLWNNVAKSSTTYSNLSKSDTTWANLTKTQS